MGNKSFSVLPPTGDDINPGKPLKHYWVVIKGLPLKLGGKLRIQSLVNGFWDLIEIDWYNEKWLDNRWVRVKLAMADLSLMPPHGLFWQIKQGGKLCGPLCDRSYTQVFPCWSLDFHCHHGPVPFPRRLFPDLN